MIMIKIKKEYNIKIMSLFVVMSVFFTSMAYSIPISNKFYLRVPLISSRGRLDQTVDNFFGFQRLRNPYPQNPHLLHLFIENYNNRPAFIRIKDSGVVKLDEFSENYRLKYPKVLALIQYASICKDDVVLDPFSGTGGIVTASSFGSYGNPKELIGLDSWLRARYIDG